LYNYIEQKGARNVQYVYILQISVQNSWNISVYTVADVRV